jgi:flagellar biosynthesis protein FlhF
MHLKRYRGKTLRDALRAVREDLGPDALVLSTTLVRARGPHGWLGRRVVEIAAAVERSEVSEDRHRTSAGRTQDSGVNALAARLGASGMEPAVARALALAHPATSRRGADAVSLHQTLTEELGALAAPEETLASVEVFVGPPGAGKTTTIAKIAAQERARSGRRIGLLAADGFRVGAVEQLRLFAEIIGSPLAVARNADELCDALDQVRRPLLLDTPGRSAGDDGSRDIFKLVGRREGVRTHLVLPASTPPDLARRTIDRFSDARPTRIVITKLDEVESLAPLVGVLKDARMPVSFVGTGQRVPEDLHRATPPAIAAWVLGEAARQGAVA